MSSLLRSYAQRQDKKAVPPYDVASVRYNQPTRQDMAVVLAFFNPANSFRIVQNLYTVKQLLEMADIPVYIGEVAHAEKPFVLQAAPNIYQYRTSSIMFYKENIMAQVIRHIPDRFKKVLLLDADILFADPDWYDKVSESLDTFEVVQPFLRAFQLDISFRVRSIKESIFTDKVKNNTTHQGYAWAFQRAWLDANPLFEYALVGGGDTMVYNSLTRHRSTINAYAADISKREREGEHVSCMSVPLDIIHLPHGSIENRQYGTRHTMIVEFMTRHKLTRLSDAVYRRPDGIFEWRREYRDLIHEPLLAYFLGRNDDGI